MRSSLCCIAVLFALLACPWSAEALTIENRLSPRNRERPARDSTRFIILHTTEGAAKGALEKLRRGGEANYLVDRNGKIYRIIDKNRVARHAGWSMWNGLSNLDRHSIGIELVGYHDKNPPARQLRSLAELIRQLQSVYGISDERVLTHSMVAFGQPNRYHRRRHRGRKRCAMNLADGAVRKALGLSAAPSRDPDVDAGRLVVADRELARVLYGKSSRPHRSSSARIAQVEPSPTKPAVQNTKARSASKPLVAQVLPKGSMRVVRRSNRTAVELAGRAHDDASTIYMFPSGLVRNGRALERDRRYRSLLKDLPVGTRILLGYQNGGYVSSRRPPSVICGSKWRDESTVYRLPNGNLLAGDEVRPESIPKSTLVFFRG